MSLFKVWFKISQTDFNGNYLPYNNNSSYYNNYNNIQIGQTHTCLFEDSWNEKLKKTLKYMLK